MSIELLEKARAALGGLNSEVVFVGAATIPLWLTDPAAPPLRPTKDVDLVAEVFTLLEYQRFENRLREAGFRDSGDMIGRFLYGENDRQLDLIPADGTILGFENKWQRASIPDAVQVELPSGAEIRALPPVNLLATKLEAFAGRGKEDYLGSPDFEDIVSIVDGRAELVREVSLSSGELQAYVASQVQVLLGSARAVDAVTAHLEFGHGGRERAESITIPRFERIAELIAN